jgi:hypothetical protein
MVEEAQDTFVSGQVVGGKFKVISRNFKSRSPYQNGAYALSIRGNSPIQ